MSRQRQAIIASWLDENGDRHERRVRSRDESEPLSRHAPPRSTWLVEVFDPAKHRLAVLVANAGESALVYAAGGTGPSFVLVSDGLAGALVTHDEGEPHPVVTALGTPRAQFPVFCHVCRTDFVLDAARLRSGRGPKPGKPGRFTVGAPHSA